MIRTKSLVYLLVFLLFIFSYSSASAHAELTGASPAADEVISVWPVEVILTFNEELISTEDQQVNVITVTDSSGSQIDLQNSNISGNRVSVGLPTEVSSGSYFVNYRVVSSDGHIVEDSYEFVYDGGDQNAEITIQEEPEATPYITQEEESSSNLGLILGIVTLASFVLIAVSFRKNRNK